LLLRILLLRVLLLRVLLLRVLLLRIWARRSPRLTGWGCRYRSWVGGLIGAGGSGRRHRNSKEDRANHQPFHSPFSPQ